MQSFTRRRMIVVLLLTSIMLVTLDLRDSGFVGGVRDTFGTVFRPVERLTNVITSRCRMHGAEFSTTESCAGRTSR